MYMNIWTAHVTTHKAYTYSNTAMKLDCDSSRVLHHLLTVTQLVSGCDNNCYEMYQPNERML